MKRLFIIWGVFCLILSSCSEDESVSEGENQRNSDVKSLIEVNFLPTFTNYYGRDIGTITFRSASLAAEWVHEYDESGRLTKSIMYDKYSSKILKEIFFSDYSSNNLEIKVEITNYLNFSTFPTPYIENIVVQLNEDFSPSMIISDDGDKFNSFDELNSQKWVTKLGELRPNGEKIWTTNYEYDTDGKVTKYNTTYHQYSIQDANVDYTYTDFGDPKSYHFQNEEGDFSKVDYFYRGDNSLERLEEAFDWGDANVGNNIFTYDENEAFRQKITNYQDGSKEVVDYNLSEGIIIEKHFGTQGVISEIYTYQLMDENYFLSTQEVYQSGIIASIEYFNTDNLPVKKEFYDSNGDLEYTEYYDENGNLTDTIYE